MRLRFTKMHGLGNDFVVIDGINQRVQLSSEQVVKIADRRLGIGCDQVLVVETPQSAEVDFRYRIFNEDGSEVENCGNGARCFARFVRDRQLTGKSTIVVETCSGSMTLMVEDNGDITVNMGVPELEPAAIPFIPPPVSPSVAPVVAPSAPAKRERLYSLPLANGVVEIAAVAMGNPHAVMVVDSIDRAPVATLGPEIERHPAFPKRVNAGFMEVVARDTINLRVFERGAGETLACGTASCAAVVAGHLRGLLDERVRVHLPGGSLDIRWRGEGYPVMMTGPTATVFHGQITL